MYQKILLAIFTINLVLTEDGLGYFWLSCFLSSLFKFWFSIFTTGIVRTKSMNTNWLNSRGHVAFE